MEQKTIDALRWIVNILNKNNITYQISGGFAAKLYGSPRKLNDIDIDIPDSSIIVILSEVSTYIIEGPYHYKDEKWDCERLVLDYFGQEIDLCGADTLKITNKERTRWIEGSRFRNLEMIVEGVVVKVVHPADLIEYKKELDGDHQLVDIEAAQKFLNATQ